MSRMSHTIMQVLRSLCPHSNNSIAQSHLDTESYLTVSSCLTLLYTRSPLYNIYSTYCDNIPLRVPAAHLGEKKKKSYRVEFHGSASYAYPWNKALIYLKLFGTSNQHLIIRSKLGLSFLGSLSHDNTREGG